MSKLDWGLAVLIMGGAVIFAYGSNGEVLPIQILGLISAGIGLLVGSFRLARTGRLAIWKVRRMGEGEIQGLYAGLWGLILFISGAGLLVAAGERVLGRESMTIDFVARHPGTFIVILSLIPILVGYPSLFTPSRENANLSETLHKVLDRARGILLFLLGFGLFSLGMFEIFFPSGFDSLIRAISESLNLVR